MAVIITCLFFSDGGGMAIDARCWCVVVAAPEPGPPRGGEGRGYLSFHSVRHFAAQCSPQLQDNKMKLYAAVLALALTSVNAFTVTPMHVTAKAPMAAERPAFAAREGESALEAVDQP